MVMVKIERLHFKVFQWKHALWSTALDLSSWLLKAGRANPPNRSFSLD